MKMLRWNWWRIGFLVMLVVFEFTREFAVLESDVHPNIAIGSAISQRLGDGDLVTASGVLQRDDGQEVRPNAIEIECHRDIGTCVTAQVHFDFGYVSTPDIDIIPATFTNTGAEFTDTFAYCTQVFYRIDGVHNVTTAVDSMKQPRDPVGCPHVVPTIAMHLSGPDFSHMHPLENHFVPLLRLVEAIINAFN